MQEYFFLLNFVSKTFYFTTYSDMYNKPVNNYWWALIKIIQINETHSK